MQVMGDSHELTSTRIRSAKRMPLLAAAHSILGDKIHMDSVRQQTDSVIAELTPNLPSRKEIMKGIVSLGWGDEGIDLVDDEVEAFRVFLDKVEGVDVFDAREELITRVRASAVRDYGEQLERLADKTQRSALEEVVSKVCRILVEGMRENPNDCAERAKHAAPLILALARSVPGHPVIDTYLSFLECLKLNEDRTEFAKHTLRLHEIIDMCRSDQHAKPDTATVMKSIKHLQTHSLSDPSVVVIVNDVFRRIGACPNIHPTITDELKKHSKNMQPDEEKSYFGGTITRAGMLRMAIITVCVVVIFVLLSAIFELSGEQNAAAGQRKPLTDPREKYAVSFSSF